MPRRHRCSACGKALPEDEFPKLSQGIKACQGCYRPSSTASSQARHADPMAAVPQQQQQPQQQTPPRSAAQSETPPRQQQQQQQAPQVQQQQQQQRAPCTPPPEVQQTQAPPQQQQQQEAPDAPEGKGTVAEAASYWLAQVAEHVAKTVPTSCWPDPRDPPMQIPNIDILTRAAAKLNDGPNPPEDNMLMIQKLLFRAANYDQVFPTIENFSKLLTFPQMHHLHPTMGNEWYWIGFNVPVVNNRTGVKGECAILYSLQKFKAIGQSAAKAMGWTDMDTMIIASIGSASVRNDDGTTKYVRRNWNKNWHVLDSEAADFSAPGENWFITNGPDYMESIPPQPATTKDILPIRCCLDDQDHFSFKCNITHGDGVDKTEGFFLQGLPNPAAGMSGTGFTPDPTPGLYYSWPQVKLPKGEFTELVIEGDSYTVTGDGNGWIDHQMMMQTLKNPADAQTGSTVQPVPYLQDPLPNNGWLWQFQNFTGGKKSWTGASFCQGNPGLAVITIEPYGYVVDLQSNGKWKGSYQLGVTYEPLDDPTTKEAHLVTAPAGLPPQQKGEPAAPYVSTVSVPSHRAFFELSIALLAKAKKGDRAAQAKLSEVKAQLQQRQQQQASDATNALSSALSSVEIILASNWEGIDGAFNNPDWSMAAEIPADFKNVLGMKTGWGYLETVSWEPITAMEERLLHYLSNGLPQTHQW